MRRSSKAATVFSTRARAARPGLPRYKPAMSLTSSEIADAAQRLGGAPADEVLRWALARFGRKLAIASSFSVEDCVVIHLAHAIDPNVRVFALDTGRLPEETFQTAERVRQKYGLAIEWQFPDRV